MRARSSKVSLVSREGYVHDLMVSTHGMTDSFRSKRCRNDYRQAPLSRTESVSTQQQGLLTCTGAARDQRRKNEINCIRVARTNVDMGETLDETNNPSASFDSTD